MSIPDAALLGNKEDARWYVPPHTDDVVSGFSDYQNYVAYHSCTGFTASCKVCLALKAAGSLVEESLAQGDDMRYN